MARYDGNGPDPADEHDIRELRNYVQSGSQPQFAGKPAKKGCPLFAVALLGAGAGLVACAVELVGSLGGWL